MATLMGYADQVSVAPGETLMQIVPEKDALIIDAQLRPQDVDHVALGQMAEGFAHR